MTGPPRIGVDTSVAVPPLVASHEAHPWVSRWAVGRTLVLCGHALAETYSVLTRLPGDARVSPADAALVIDDRFPDAAPLSPTLAGELHHHLARAGIAGGATYDALVARAHGVALATRDARARETYAALGARVEIVADR